MKAAHGNAIPEVSGKTRLCISCGWFVDRCIKPEELYSEFPVCLFLYILLERRVVNGNVSHM